MLGQGLGPVSICKIKALDGTPVEFVDDEVIGSGAMKEVYFSPCKSYVVAFFRAPLDIAGMERLEMITDRYRKSIFDNEQGDYWRHLFCWPEKIVEHNGLTGIVVPTYQSHFFFEHGSVNDDFLNIKGKEKQGKTDKVDSRRLARGLRSNDLRGIHVFDRDHEELRSLR